MVFAFSFILFIGSYLYLLEDLKPYAIGLFLVGLAGFAWMAILSVIDGRPILRPRPLLWTAFAFWLISMLSGLLNLDPQVIAGATFVFLLYVTAMTVMRDPRAVRGALQAFLWSSGLVVLASLAKQLPSPGGSWQGVFDNPNAMGGVLATFTAVLIARAMDVSGAKRLAYVGGVVVLLGLTFLTRNRGALTAIGTCLVVALLVWLPSVLRSLKAIFWFAVACFTAPVALYFAWPYVVQPVLDKIAYKEGIKEGVTGDRIYIWQDYLSEASFFGGGRSALDNHALAAHNTYISLIAQYGWMAGIIFVLFVIGLLVYCYMKRNEIYTKYLPLMSVLSFAILGGTEGMMMKSSMFVIFLFPTGPLLKNSIIASRARFKRPFKGPAGPANRHRRPLPLCHYPAAQR